MHMKMTATIVKGHPGQGFPRGGRKNLDLADLKDDQWLSHSIQKAESWFMLIVRPS